MKGLCCGRTFADNCRGICQYLLRVSQESEINCRSLCLMLILSEVEVATDIHGPNVTGCQIERRQCNTWM